MKCYARCPNSLASKGVKYVRELMFHLFTDVLQPSPSKTRMIEKSCVAQIYLPPPGNTFNLCGKCVGPSGLRLCDALA